MKKKLAEAFGLIRKETITKKKDYFWNHNVEGDGPDDEDGEAGADGQGAAKKQKME